MRDIRFRGRRLDNGEWAYGNLIITTNPFKKEDEPFGYFIHSGPNIMAPEPVDPKTVGQFTGLKDKAGKEIFEGDLISEGGSAPYEVIWQHHSVQWIMQSLSEGRYYRHMAMDYAAKSYEIIGNVFDNPDLLQEIK